MAVRCPARTRAEEGDVPDEQAWAVSGIEGVGHDVSERERAQVATLGCDLTGSARWATGKRERWATVESRPTGPKERERGRVFLFTFLKFQIKFSNPNSNQFEV